MYNNSVTCKKLPVFYFTKHKYIQHRLKVCTLDLHGSVYSSSLKLTTITSAQSRQHMQIVRF